MSTTVLSPEEYLVIERAADSKSEYFQGKIWAKTRVNHAHCLLTGNLLCSSHSQLRGRACKALMSNMRICTGPNGFYTYPDVLVYCGEPRLLDSEEDTLLNPFLIAEVFLPSTEACDRGFRFEQYKQSGSLREYLLVSAVRVRVELSTRQANGRWQLSSRSRLDETLEIPSLECVLSLADVYDEVKL